MTCKPIPSLRVVNMITALCHRSIFTRLHWQLRSYQPDILVFDETQSYQMCRMKGYYHSQMAPLCRPNVDAAIDHYRKAGNFYMAAAGKYPEDDEKHACKSAHCLDSPICQSSPFRFPQLRRSVFFQVRNAATRDSADPQTYTPRYTKDDENLGCLFCIYTSQK